MVSVILANSAFMMIDTATLCPKNCSGNGDCLSGICLCQVKYTGWSCSDSNLVFYWTFGVLFYLISLTTIIQLVMRIRSQLHSSPSHLACRLDIQKLIYFFVICATGSRAIYFTCGIHDIMPPGVVQKNLFSVFYPFVLSGFSLIICFWAESFHLSGLQLEKPRFLTKSFCGFLAFNTLVYVILVAQAVSNNFFDNELASKLNEVFNGCFAFLMFFVLVFFLIYGVELFYKVKGAFKTNESGEKNVNIGQLYQSRMGLGIQAGFQLAVTMFLMSEVVGEMWKQHLSTEEKNVVEVSFRLAELACILWFPCALWNVNRPGKLWVLNPRNLLTTGSVQEDMHIVSGTPISDISDVVIERAAEEGNRFSTVTSPGDCWICYDKEKNEQMIQPCNCKGDMRLVHHECLKVWLVEKSMSSGRKLSCSVCKEEYKVVCDSSTFWTPNKVQFTAWAQTFFVIATMASLPVILFFVWYKIHQAVAKTALVIFMFLGEYCLLRLLGFNFVKAYNITRTRALRILGNPEIIETDMGVHENDDSEGTKQVEGVIDDGICKTQSVEIGVSYPGNAVET